jgi:hypothetical protein
MGIWFSERTFTTLDKSLREHFTRNNLLKRVAWQRQGMQPIKNITMNTSSLAKKDLKEW